MPEIRTARTARKTHYCGMRSAGCTRLIRPGDRHVVTALPPVGDILTFPGRTGWRRIRSCAGCIQTLYGQTPDERAVRPVVTTPTRPHCDEPRLDRPVIDIPLPA
jgi:hypothetical protein